MHAAPAVSCAVCTKKCAHEHTGSAEAIRHSLRNGFTAYGALSPATGFLATVIPEKRLLLTNLTPAPGRQDHTLLPYATATLVRRSFRVHHIPPRVNDDRETPLWSDRTAEVVALIARRDEEENFASLQNNDSTTEALDRGSDLPVGQPCGRDFDILGRRIKVSSRAASSLADAPNKTSPKRGSTTLFEKLCRDTE
jgi:hypothetical protein